MPSLHTTAAHCECKGVEELKAIPAAPTIYVLLLPDAMFCTFLLHGASLADTITGQAFSMCHGEIMVR